jgi:hypothetical protein
MSNDWNPDAPDVNKEFSRAEQATQKPVKPKQVPVSRLELDQLREERGKPVLEPTLTIGGSVETAVHKQIKPAQANRRQYIKARLSAIRGRAKDDFERSGDDDDIS